MKKVSLPYVERRVVKGKEYYYFRKTFDGKSKYFRLPENPDSPEFVRAYWEIRRGKHIESKTSWNNLIIAFYNSPRYKTKAKGTRENYRRHCEAIREKNGAKDVKTFRRKDALRVQSALQDNWSKANERLAVLSILCKLAVDLEWIERSPVTDIQKLTGGEYEAWPEDRLEAFEKYCVKEGKATARTVYELCVGTGQRLNDCVQMAWSDFDGEFMAVVQEKTGAKIWVYCPERLRTYLASLQREGRYILARNLTQSIGKRAAQKAVEEVREAIGVMRGENRLVPHGWRYTAAKHLAEAGCSDSEIQAVTGHKTLAMVQKYRSQANQKLASKRAQTLREQSKSKT